MSHHNNPFKHHLYVTYKTNNNDSPNVLIRPHSNHNKHQLITSPPPHLREDQKHQFQPFPFPPPEQAQTPQLEEDETIAHICVTDPKIFYPKKGNEILASHQDGVPEFLPEDKWNMPKGHFCRLINPKKVLPKSAIPIEPADEDVRDLMEVADHILPCLANLNDSEPNRLREFREKLGRQLDVNFKETLLLWKRFWDKYNMDKMYTGRDQYLLDELKSGNTRVTKAGKYFRAPLALVEEGMKRTTGIKSVSQVVPFGESEDGCYQQHFFVY